jgi:hypothetical protein
VVHRVGHRGRCCSPRPLLGGVAILCRRTYYGCLPRRSEMDNRPPDRDGDSCTVCRGCGGGAQLFDRSSLRQEPQGAAKVEALHRILASFSYTLYLVHFPAVVFIAAFMNAVFGIGYLRQPNLTTIVYGGALLTMVYGYAWIFAGFTEAHTNAVRSRLSRAIPALLYWTKSLGPQKGLQAD